MFLLWIFKFNSKSVWSENIPCMMISFFKLLIEVCVIMSQMLPL